MDAEQMELLERLVRLRDLGAISRREFVSEKEAVLRALPRPATVHLRALPAPGQTAAAVAVAPPPHAVVSAPARPRPVAARAESTLLERVSRYAGWILWILFSIGGLDALLDRDPLDALSLLCCGLLLAPPFHRLLGTRMSLPTRLAATLLGLVAALGIGSAPPGHRAGLAPTLPPKAAAACGSAISEAAQVGGARAREGIVRPWVKLWTDVRWARIAGLSAFEEWRSGRG